MSTSCAVGQLGGANQQIRAPQAFVSPNMDFTKITKVGVFPIFPASNPASPYASISDEDFSEALASALSSELQTRQAQWGIVDYKSLLNIVSRANLGTGYKNLQADMNTSYAMMQGGLVLSPATKRFMSDIQKAAGVDAFLIGTYGLTREPRSVGSLVAVTREVDVASVRLVLIAARESEAWWTASVGRYGNREGVVREIAQSLAANLGKGTLRQM
ncbi:MAG: hypothetical protein IT359_14400 [Gemmatimonadaceae bacterium]|nr:hypothetical protein [Gemmatimonadaceae bacterium]